jgi:FAD-linked sulfhydryl oxidase
VSNKREASVYVCELHNAVNDMLDKPLVSCDADTVLRMWHPGYPNMEDAPSIEQQIDEANAATAATERSTVKSGRGAMRFGWNAAAQDDGTAASTNVDDVLKKLKGCQVYCPDKKVVE